MTALALFCIIVAAIAGTWLALTLIALVLP